MMPKFYYFSEKSLKFVELKKSRFKGLFFTLIGAFSLILLFVIAIYVFNISPLNTTAGVKNENALLIEKLKNLTEKYSSLDQNLDSLIKVNNELRIAANLRPLGEEDRIFGKGGKTFNGLFDFLSLGNKAEIQKSFEFIDEIEKKFDFEKKNFEEIANTLKYNKALYKAIPAIKPAAGTLALHGFGMRLHPILNVRKMHEGLDIITDVGTPVFSTADGIVSFVGKKGGYGLTVEIDHGFGYSTLYGHLSKTQVKEGETVNRGTLIARTGNTGLSSGPHLHYEVSHNGIKLNPEDFIFESSELFTSENESAKRKN